MQRAVIFDLDGVLVESEPYWQAGFAEVVNASARESDWLDPGLQRDHMGSYQGGRVDETLRDVLAKIGHSAAAMDDPLVRSLTDRVIEHVSAAFLDHPTPIDESVRAAQELYARGMRLGVASSSAPQFIDIALRVTGLDGVIAARQSALGLATGKPHPEVYELLLRQLGARADRCVAIEDSAPGIGAAVAAGIPCIGLRRHDEPIHRFDDCVWVTDALDADEVEDVLSGRLRRSGGALEMG